MEDSDVWCRPGAPIRKRGNDTLLSDESPQGLSVKRANKKGVRSIAPDATTKKISEVKANIPISNNRKDSFGGKDNDLLGFTFASGLPFLLLEIEHGLIIGIESNGGIERLTGLAANEPFNDPGLAVCQ